MVSWVASLLVFCTAVAVAAAPRPVQLDDLEGVKSGQVALFSTLDLSPDGRRLALERGGELTIVDTRSGHIVRDLGEGLLPRWSPDGRRLAFYSRRSGSLQLWVLDGALHQATALPNGIDPDIETRIMGTISDAFRYSWSPDGNRIVFASRVGVRTPVANERGAPLVLTTTTPPALTLQDVFAHPGGGTGGVVEARNGRDLSFRAPHAGENLFNQLFAVDVQSGKTTQLTTEHATAFHPAWSPDGKTIAYARIGPAKAGAAAPEVVSATAGAIVLLDLASHRTLTIDDGAGIKFLPRWSPDGSRLAYLTSPSFEGAARLRIVRDGKAEDGLALRGPVVDYDWNRAMPGGAFVVSYIGDGGSSAGPRARAIDIADIARKTSHSIESWAEDRKGDIAWIDGDTHAVFLSPANRAAPTRIPVASPDTNLKLSKIETVTWRNARNETLTGSLLYPADYRAGQRYPLIVDVYPFPYTGGWMNAMSGNQAWASAGYMVFKPQPRAPHSAPNCSGSRAFCAAGEGPAGLDVMEADVMGGIAALERRGLIDRGRMCLFGHSNGGGVVDYLVTRKTTFKCAVAVAPVLPNWLGTSFLWYDGLGLMSRMAGAKPWDDPGAYVKLSAALRANKVKTPMLLADGDEDGEFLLGSIEMYNALRAAGADVTLLRYPNQGHTLTGDALHDFWRREMTFFAKYLKADPKRREPN